MSKFWINYCCFQKTCHNTNKHKISTETCEDCISRNTCLNLLIFFANDFLRPSAGPKTLFLCYFLHFLLSQIQPQNPFLIHCAANYSRPSVLIDSKLWHFIYSNLEAGPSLCIHLIFYLYETTCTSLSGDISIISRVWLRHMNVQLKKHQLCPV